jgi:ubiquinone/menaquinone biosynthesis C-methylase UbiE
MIPTNDDRQRSYWEEEHGFRPYDHPVVRVFATQRIRFVSRFVNLGTVSSVLDVGCGSGASSYYYGRFVREVHGVDRSHAMLACNPLSAECLHCADATELPFEDDSFDLVNAWELLHHVECPLKIVKEIVRVSREYVVLFEPNRYNPALAALAVVDPEHRWILRYSMSFMRRLAEAAELDIKVSRVVGCIFPNKTPLFLARLLERMPYRLPAIGISNALICRKRRRRNL